jgi:hypothetical protein
MKPKMTISKRVPRFAPLPDPPLSSEDIPPNTAPITQRELVNYQNAQLTYQTALAYFEMKRATIMLRLLAHSSVEPGRLKAWINRDELVIASECSCCLMTHESTDYRYVG